MVSIWSPIVRYVGLSDVPPVYPTRVLTTPGRLPNRESGPQNHPRANVALSVSAGAEASMGGISADRGTVRYSLLTAIAVPPSPEPKNTAMSSEPEARKYARADPNASSATRIVRRLRREGVTPLTGFLSPSLRRSPIRSRPGQGLHHLFHGDLPGVEMYRVDLPNAAESLFNLFHAGQPLQGRFSHVVSGHVECGRCISLPRRARVARNPGYRQGEKSQEYD